MRHLGKTLPVRVGAVAIVVVAAWIAGGAPIWWPV